MEQNVSAETLKGTVRWFNATKGFGFLQCRNTDYFFHHSEIQMNGYRTLDSEDVVEFEPGMSDKGPAAKNVKLLIKAVK